MGQRGHQGHDGTAVLGATDAEDWQLPWLSEPSGTSQKHHKMGSGANRMNGKAAMMNSFTKKFNT